VSAWPEVEMGEVFEIGSSKRVLKKDWQSHGVPFYRTREIVSLAKTGTAKSDVFISEELYEDYKLKYGVPKSGDLLVSAIGSLGIAYAVKPNDKFYFKDASVLKFSANKSVFIPYIQQVFRTDKLLGQINSVSGSTVGTLTISRAKRLKIPLPPLPEQKRIAAILDQADALRRQRQAALDRLNTLGRSIFYDMFGDDQSIELSKTCEKITDGTHQTPTYSESGVIFLSAKNVKEEVINWDQVKYIPETLHEEISRRVLPQKNDILLAKNGTTGFAAIVDKECIFSIYVSLALLRPLEHYNPTFLLYSINSEHSRRQFSKSLKGVGVPNLHLKDIRTTKIPDASITEQDRFSNQISKLNISRISYKKGLKDAETLFSSLQQRAFNGEL